MTTLILHPYCALFPQMGEAELDNLTDDIKANGFRPDQPIVKMSDGSILDGRNRALAAERAGVDPVTLIYDQAVHGDALAFVVSRNLARRHLTDVQRAMIAAEIANMNQGRIDNVTKSLTRGFVTQSEAASLMKVSIHAVGDAVSLKKHAEPNIIDMVKSGKSGLQPAANAVRRTPRDQQGNLTPADITRIHQANKNGTTSREATPPQPRERRSSEAAMKREQMLLNRPRLKSVDNGRPRGAEALEQAPGYPPGFTKGMAYTDKHGRVEIRTHEEVTRAKLYERLIEFNALVRQFVKADAWPTYDDLATLDDRRRNNVLHEWRKHRAALYAVLDAAIGHSKMSEPANDEMAS